MDWREEGLGGAYRLLKQMDGNGDGSYVAERTSPLICGSRVYVSDSAQAEALADFYSSRQREGFLESDVESCRSALAGVGMVEVCVRESAIAEAVGRGMSRGGAFFNMDTSLHPVRDTR